MDLPLEVTGPDLSAKFLQDLLRSPGRAAAVVVGLAVGADKNMVTKSWHIFLLSDPSGVVPCLSSNNSPRKSGIRCETADCEAASLTPSVELVQEAAFLKLIDESQVDELFSPGLGGFGIQGRLDFQRVPETFQARIGVFDEQFPVSRVGLSQNGPAQPARVLVHDVYDLVPVSLIIVDSLRHRPDHAPRRVRLFSNHLARGDSAGELKRDIEPGHVDDNLEASLFAVDLFAFRAHRKIDLPAHHRRNSGGTSSHGYRFDVAQREAYPLEGQTQSEVCCGAGDVNGGAFPLSASGEAISGFPMM